VSLGSLAWKLAVPTHVALFRLTGGRIGGRIRGVDCLLLHHVGRKSGQQRVHPLLYIRDGDDLVIVASKGGSPRHPAWWLNLRANPDTTVELPGEKCRVRARQATPDERARIWPRLTEVWPDYDTYQARTDREIPVVILERVQAA
jgi:F420H(2)-dependent quinone reductase